MPVTRADPADNAKELLARLDRWIEHFGKPVGNGRANPDNDMIYLLSDCRDALRLSARQQASVEEVARSLCKADGTAQCAAICLSHFSTSTTGGKCPEAALVWGHKCRALFDEYDIFEKVEG